MYVIEVIPLTLLPTNVPQILSYFFDRSLSKGAIAEVTINKRRVKAVVLSSSPVEKEKLALKKVNFQIKKINKILYEKQQVNDYQLKIAGWMAKYYYAPLGYTLKTILPSFIFKKKYQLVIHNFPLPTRQVGYPQLLIYKTNKLVKHLEPIIKETIRGTSSPSFKSYGSRFAESYSEASPSSLKSYGEARQVLILVPEKSLINYFFDYFSKKYNTAVIYSGLSNEKLYEAWNKTHTGQASIIIGTRQALNMRFKNLGLIIIDDPLHEFYKSDMLPRYNAAVLARRIAELNNSQLILASVVPGIENYYKIKSGEYVLKSVEPRPKFDTEIIDTAQEAKNANWSPISKKLNEELIACLKNNKRVLVFSPRKGYAGIVICSNCSLAIKCPQCDVAMRTHRSVEIMLVCHHCGISKPMPKNCSVCGNYNIKIVGPAGTQKIYEEIKIKLANEGIKCPVLVLDTDIVKNETEEEEIISEILKPYPSGGSSVLIATQMVFSHRFYMNFDLIAIVNADVLTKIPDFRSEENLFYQTEKLASFEPHKLLVQTYNPENKLIQKAVEGDYADFYENELKFRKTLDYPPFFKLIKLTFRHKDKNKASFAARVTTEKLKMVIARGRLEEEIKIIEATPAYIEREKGFFVYNIFLKIKEGYSNINDLLKYVGPGWIIDVEPRSLL